MKSTAYICRHSKAEIALLLPNGHLQEPKGAWYMRIVPPKDVDYVCWRVADPDLGTSDPKTADPKLKIGGWALMVDNEPICYIRFDEPITPNILGEIVIDLRGMI